MASRREQQKEATRELLFTEAMRLFAARGYEAVNIDDIVREAKVARGTFYFHFPRKDDVLVELIRRSDVHIVAKMAASRPRHALRATLEATTEAFAEMWRDHRALLPHAGAIALRKTAEVELDRAPEPLRTELVTHVEAAIASGELETILPAQMLADIFLLDVFVALMAWARTGEPSLEVVMGGVIELFLRGVTRIGT